MTFIQPTDASALSAPQFKGAHRTILLIEGWDAVNLMDHFSSTTSAETHELEVEGRW